MPLNNSLEKRLSDNFMTVSTDPIGESQRGGSHWGHVQLNFGPKPITQAVVVLHQ